MRITIELIVFVVLWLNAFPPASGVSQTYISQKIVTDRTLDYKKQCKVEFGAYIEYHKNNDQLNTLAEQTCGGICMGLTANMQGSYKVFCLQTKRRVTQKKSYTLPIPGKVIRRVKQIATQEKRYGRMIFAERVGNVTHDEPDVSPVPDAISRVGNRNDKAIWEETLTMIRPQP